MLPEFLLTETTVREAGTGPEVALGENQGGMLVLTFGAVLVGRGRLSVGELMVFYALIGQLYSPIVRLTQLFGQRGPAVRKFMHNSVKI